MNTKRYKLFTDSDLDGISCGILGNFVFKGDIDITFCVPKTVNEYLKTFIENNEYKNYDLVFITDLSIIESSADLINSSDYINFRLFDHHTSSLYLDKFEWANIMVENNYGRKECGASLFLRYLRYLRYINQYSRYYDILSLYTEYVRLWDTWEWADDEESGQYAKHLNMIFSMLDRDVFMNNIISRINNMDYSFINNSEFNIIEIEEGRKKKYIDKKMKTVQIYEVNGDKVAVVFAEEYISELGNYMAKNIPDIKYAAMIIPDINVVSLRAVKEANINLSEIAGIFGGGGNPLAAGFSFNPEFSKELIKKVFNIT